MPSSSDTRIQESGDVLGGTPALSPQPASQEFATASGKPARIAAADGVRAIAVILVFLTHHASIFSAYVQTAPQTSRLSQLVHETVTKAGVFLFFILSGYLIYSGLLRKRERYHPFVWRRIKRLYPTFLCVILIYVLLSIVFPSHSRFPDGFFPAATYLLQNLAFLPGVFPIQPIITVSWSLSYQIVFYLSVPLLISVLRLRNWPGRHRALFFLGLALLVCFSAPVLQPFRVAAAAPTGEKAPLGNESLELVPVLSVLMFISGMLLYESQGLLRLELKLAMIGEVLTLLAFLFCLWFRNQRLFAGLPALEFLQPLVIALAVVITFFWFSFYSLTFQGFLAAFFSWTPFRQLGRISYSFFLIHGLALNGAALCLNWMLPPTGQDVFLFWMMLPVGFLLSLIAAALLFALVERPFSAGAPAAKIKPAADGGRARTLLRRYGWLERQV